MSAKRKHLQGWLDVPKAVRRTIMVLAATFYTDFPELAAVEIRFDPDNGRPSVWLEWKDEAING